LREISNCGALRFSTILCNLFEFEHNFFLRVEQHFLRSLVAHEIGRRGVGIETKHLDALLLRGLIRTTNDQRGKRRLVKQHLLPFTLYRWPEMMRVRNITMKKKRVIETTILRAASIALLSSLRIAYLFGNQSTSISEQKTKHYQSFLTIGNFNGFSLLNNKRNNNNRRESIRFRRNQNCRVRTALASDSRSDAMYVLTNKKVGHKMNPRKIERNDHRKRHSSQNETKKKKKKKKKSKRRHYVEVRLDMLLFGRR
jgi:hypothetical protein